MRHLQRRVVSPMALCLLVLLAPVGLVAQIPPSEYQQRRDRLAEQLDEGVLLVLGAPEPPHDYLPFVPAPTLRYLTGITEPDAALVMVKRGGRTASLLFVQPRDPRTETWSGIRMGTDGATRATGLPARQIDVLPTVVDSLLADGGPLLVAGDVQARGDPEPPLSYDQQVIERIRRRHPRMVVRDATPAVMRLRARKSAAELELIRRAVAITVDAQENAMRLVEPGLNEFEVEALIEYTFRRSGAERPAFASIVGSGPNATILHYNRNDRFMEAGDLIVMDVGASYAGYAADVTRTVPVSGTYSEEQRAIYQIVLDAQAAAEREARVGAAWRSLSRAASRTLAEGLARLGLIESPTATYDCGDGGRQQCPQVGLFYVHGLGHGIGLEVHDPEQAIAGAAANATIQPGSAFTIEPGLYVRSNVLELLPDTPGNRALAERLRPTVRRYVDIGVRIEDDYIVTERGVEWISRAPKTIDEIETIMAQPYAGPGSRDPEMVEWYRRLRGTRR